MWQWLKQLWRKPVVAQSRPRPRYMILYFDYDVPGLVVGYAYAETKQLAEQIVLQQRKWFQEPICEHERDFLCRDGWMYVNRNCVMRIIPTFQDIPFSGVTLAIPLTPENLDKSPLLRWLQRQGDSTAREIQKEYRKA